MRHNRGFALTAAREIPEHSATLIPLPLTKLGCSTHRLSSKNGVIIMASSGGRGKRGIIGILTGGGDVPGLNPAMRAVTIRAVREGYEVIGLRRGWASLIDMVRDKDYDNSDNFRHLTE